MTDGETPRDIAPGAVLPECRVRARNLHRDAANRIHDDETARRYGYAGALVAGVTVYGYLARLAVAAWGLDWLRRGTASVRFLRPVYDGDELTLGGRVVGRSANPVAGEAVVELEARAPGGDVAATMVAGLAWGGPALAPDPRGYPAAPLPEPPPVATHDTLGALGALGAPALALDAETLARAADDLDDALPVYRAPDGLAHPGLLLRQANRALSENLRLGPWIHAASDVAHCGVARATDRLETRGRVARVYERRERGWVDLDLLVVANGSRPVALIRHTAIYRLGEGPPAAG